MVIVRGTSNNECYLPERDKGEEKMSSYYKLDKRHSLSYEECLALTIKEDGAELEVSKTVNGNRTVVTPPKKYDESYDYGIWDGKNYLHIFFDQTNYKGKPYRVCFGERYGNNEVEDLLDILGRSTWIG